MPDTAGVQQKEEPCVCDLEDFEWYGIIIQSSQPSAEFLFVSVCIRCTSLL